MEKMDSFKNMTATSGEIDALLERLRKESLEKSLLLEISKNINSTLDPEKVLNLILDSLSHVIPFDAAGIFLVDRTTNKLLPESIIGYDREALKHAHLKVGKGLTGLVAIQGTGIICPDVSKEPKYINARKETRSALIVPLFVKERVLGVLSLESDTLNAFDEDDLSLLTVFANHAAIAIDNARLHKEVLKSRELRHDLKVARRIQKALLPKALPSVSGYGFATTSVPSKTVSGDFYDVMRLATGKVAITIGDVSGKGTPAAILMASMYSSYKSQLYEPLAVQEKIYNLNNVLRDSTLIGNYATLFYGELDPTENELTFCNAGHFPPIVIRKDGTLEELKTGGTVLGFIHDADYRDETIKFESGDILLLYTDGLIEARNEKMEFFEIEKAISAIPDPPSRSAEEIKEIIINQATQFTGSDRFEDDLTLIIIKVE